MTKGFRCKINDWYGIHQGFNLLLRPGYTALVGPNGAGKSTLLRQIKELAEDLGLHTNEMAQIYMECVEEVNDIWDNVVGIKEDN